MHSMGFLLRWWANVRYGCVQEGIKIKDNHKWKRLMLPGIVSNHEIQI